MRPGDIVTAMNGTTIEINNTDAEGRLILADALCYAVEQGVERIVDLATLTGAIIVALGSTYAGLFSNDDDWFAVEAAGETTGELGWRLPLDHAEYKDLIKGEYADISNAPERARRRRSWPPSSCAASWTTSPGCTWTSPAPPGGWTAPTRARARRATACGP